jgi:hypothetical protein
VKKQYFLLHFYVIHIEFDDKMSAVSERVGFEILQPDMALARLQKKLLSMKNITFALVDIHDDVNTIY